MEKTTTNILGQKFNHSEEELENQKRMNWKIGLPVFISDYMTANNPEFAALFKAEVKRVEDSATHVKADQPIPLRTPGFRSPLVIRPTMVRMDGKIDMYKDCTLFDLRPFQCIVEKEGFYKTMSTASRLNGLDLTKSAATFNKEKDSPIIMHGFPYRMFTDHMHKYLNTFKYAEFQRHVASCDIPPDTAPRCYIWMLPIVKTCGSIHKFLHTAYDNAWMKLFEVSNQLLKIPALQQFCALHDAALRGISKSAWNALEGTATPAKFERQIECLILTQRYWRWLKPIELPQLWQELMNLRDLIYDKENKFERAFAESLDLTMSTKDVWYKYVKNTFKHQYILPTFASEERIPSLKIMCQRVICTERWPISHHEAADLLLHLLATIPHRDLSEEKENAWRIPEINEKTSLQFVFLEPAWKHYNSICEGISNNSRYKVKDHCVVKPMSENFEFAREYAYLNSIKGPIFTSSSLFSHLISGALLTVVAPRREVLEQLPKDILAEHILAITGCDCRVEESYKRFPCEHLYSTVITLALTYAGCPAIDQLIIHDDSITALRDFNELTAIFNETIGRQTVFHMTKQKSSDYNIDKKWFDFPGSMRIHPTLNFLAKKNLMDLFSYKIENCEDSHPSYQEWEEKVKEMVKGNHLSYYFVEDFDQLSSDHIKILGESTWLSNMRMNGEEPAMVECRYSRMAMAEEEYKKAKDKVTPYMFGTGLGRKVPAPNLDYVESWYPIGWPHHCGAFSDID